jgi:hypothetical protein
LAVAIDTASDGVGAELFLVGRAVEFEHGPIDRALIQRVEAGNFFGDLFVDVADRGEHALTAVDFLVFVAEFPSFVLAGAGSARHGGAAERTVGQRHVAFDGRVAAAIKNLASMNIDDGGTHNGLSVLMLSEKIRRRRPSPRRLPDDAS